MSATGISGANFPQKFGTTSDTSSVDTQKKPEQITIKGAYPEANTYPTPYIPIPKPQMPEIQDTGTNTYPTPYIPIPKPQMPEIQDTGTNTYPMPYFPIPKPQLGPPNFLPGAIPGADIGSDVYKKTGQ